MIPNARTSFRRLAPAVAALVLLLVWESACSYPRAQAAATGMAGFADTHVGVLEDPAAVQALSKLLEATTAPTAH